MTIDTNFLRIAVLVDLPRSAQAGGHVKCWERLATAAAQSQLPLDLTVYFSGTAPDEVLSPRVRLRHLPPIFSTSRLKFLPYVPDHTDLSPWHPQLARELTDYDLIHTTDGFFAFAQTADKVSRAFNIPLVTSFHTDTPSYASIFTRQTIEKILRKVPMLSKFLTETLRLPDRQGERMLRKLQRHVKACHHALITRPEDHILAASVLGDQKVRQLRLGINKEMFGTHRADRARILHDYNIPADRQTILFVGRVDVGKNIQTLVGAVEEQIRKGAKLHLIVAGVGPMSEDVHQRLGDHVSLPGFVAPNELARLYASVDMLALCSEVEIRSMAGVEAMASGCPVLVSRKSGIAELFEHTPAMTVVDSGVKAWSAALQDFAANPAHQQTMRRAANIYSNTYLASWQQVLTEDIFAVWQQAVYEREIAPLGAPQMGLVSTARTA